MAETEDFLGEQEFYDLMQSYRHAPLTNQPLVVDAFEAVKAYIREHTVQVKKVDIDADGRHSAFSNYETRSQAPLFWTEYKIGGQGNGE